MKQAIRLVIAGLLVALATACASIEAKSPAQRVFAAQSDYNAVLTLAVAYESQPRCLPASTTKACSEPSVVAVLRKADVDAYAALKAAQETVRSPGASDSTINLAITGAVNAIGAMRTILKNHGIGG